MGAEERVARRSELRVRVERVALYDHPLFGPEDRLYARLRILYGEYRRRLEAQTVSYLRRRLRAVEAEDVAAALVAEDQSLAEIAEALYTTWNQLKGLREHQGFASTPAKLVAVNLKRKDEEEQSRSPHEQFVLKLRTTDVTPDDQVPVRELVRRRRARHQEFAARLSVHGHKVALTARGKLEWPTFTVALDYEARLRLERRPVDVRVDLWHKSALIARIRVPVPGTAVDNATAQSLAPITTWCHFSSEKHAWDDELAAGDDVQVLASRRNASQWVEGTVGKVKRRCTGTYFEVRTGDAATVWAPRSKIRRGDGLEVRRRRVTGAALVATGWTGLGCTDTLPPRPDERTAAIALTAGVTPCTQQVASLLALDDGFRFDPNDPRNQDLARKKRSARATVHGGFRAQELKLRLSKVAPRLTPRLELLALRARKPHLVPGAVPVDDAACSPLFPPSDEHATTPWSQRIREALARRGQRLSVAALVRPPHQNDPPALLRRKRNLRPSVAVPVASVAAPTTAAARLLVQVVAATDVPPRSAAPESNATTLIEAAHEARQRRDRVGETHYFVTASFQEHRRTSTKARAARWKDVLDLPFVPPQGEFAPSNLARVEDVLELGLFCETVGGSTTFLGDLTIPFATIYKRSGELAANLPLRVPDARIPAIKERPWLQIAVFLRPPLKPPPRCVALSSTREDARLLRYGEVWSRDLRSYLENLEAIVRRAVDPGVKRREVSAFGTYLSGDDVLLCRLLRPLKAGRSMTVDEAVRFVSLVPLVAETGVWCTSKDVLDEGFADRAGHAVLLQNLLASLGDAYLLTGTGLPDGSAAWVAHKRDDGTTRVLDPVTGREVHPELVDISCVVTPDNVFANIQPHTKCLDDVGDVANASRWRPFFVGGDDDDVIVGTRCCSCFPGPRLAPRPHRLDPLLLDDDDVVLAPTDVDEAARVQTTLSETIKKHIQKWRASTTTEFASEDVIARVQNQLAHLENHEQSLTLENPHIEGVALNTPHDPSTILARLQATNLHVQRQATFVVAVYVHPHPGVLSVWVYYGISPT